MHLILRVLDIITKFSNITALCTTCLFYNITGKLICKCKIILDRHHDCNCTNGFGKSLIKRIIKNSDITITKFIQWLSMRPDIINNRLFSIFTDYKNNCSTHPFSHTEKILHDTKLTLDKFDYINDIPIASGSIAQVYKGRMKKENFNSIEMLDVAIKVKHPNIDNSIKNYDIFIKVLLNPRMPRP